MKKLLIILPALFLLTGCNIDQYFKSKQDAIEGEIQKAKDTVNEAVKTIEGAAEPLNDAMKTVEEAKKLLDEHGDTIEKMKDMVEGETAEEKE